MRNKAYHTPDLGLPICLEVDCRIAYSVVFPGIEIIRTKNTECLRGLIRPMSGYFACMKALETYCIGAEKLPFVVVCIERDGA